MPQRGSAGRDPGRAEVGRGRRSGRQTEGESLELDHKRKLLRFLELKDLCTLEGSRRWSRGLRV